MDSMKKWLVVVGILVLAVVVFVVQMRIFFKH